MLAQLGRWEESLALHRESLAEDSTGWFTLCRIGEALAALGREKEALTFLTRALRKHAQELRADTANLFTRLAIVEDRVRNVQRDARPARRAGVLGAARSSAKIAVEPNHAFARAFLARPGAIWAKRSSASRDVRSLRGRSADYRLAASEQFRRSRDIWADLKSRGLVSPVDTGRLAEAERAYARAEEMVTAER